jgi:cysteine-rich repeat protein
MAVTTTKKLKSLRVTLKRNEKTFAYASLDAVAVISKDNQDTCQGCPKIQYNVARDGVVIGQPTTTRSFTDSGVTAGTVYKYKVQATYTGDTGKTSPWSVELTHTAGTVYCGNGKKEAGEDCDDGNAVDGDGCSMKCKVEDGFYCDTTNDPSKCVVGCGDGKCTAGEKLTCPKDCGYYDGVGEFNQWVKSATWSGQATQLVTAITGMPTKFATCTKLGKDDAFEPKAASSGFITAEFETAVTPTAIEVYLTNDAAILTLSIFDTAGKEHVLPTNAYGAKCTTQPWRYSLPLTSANRKDSLSRVYSVNMAPVFTKKIKVTIAQGGNIGGYFDISKVQITGIRLRSDTAALQGACSILNGANSVWSTNTKACITAPSQTKYTACPSSKPLMQLQSCFSSNFCSAGGKLAECRTKCKWGATTTEKTFDFTLKMTGITKAQFGTDLQTAYKETMAESLQISANKINITSIMEVSRRATQLRVLSKISMPNEAAATAAKADSNNLVTSGTFVKNFRTKSLAKGVNLPALSVASTSTVVGGGPVPTPTPTPTTPTPTPTPTPPTPQGKPAVMSPAALAASAKVWKIVLVCGAVALLRGVWD